MREYLSNSERPSNREVTLLAEMAQLLGLLVVFLASATAAFEELVYSNAYTKDFHHYVPGWNGWNTNTAVPAITSPEGRFIFNGRGYKTGFFTSSIEFLTLPEQPANTDCKGQLAIEWSSKKYCLDKMTIIIDGHELPPDALRSDYDPDVEPNIFSKITRLFTPTILPLVTTKTAAMELHFKTPGQMVESLDIRIPLFQESSDPVINGKHSSSTIKAEPLTLDQLKQLRQNKNIIDFNGAWIAPLLWRPMVIDSAGSETKKVYITYPVVMPRTHMAELLPLVEGANSK